MNNGRTQLGCLGYVGDACGACGDGYALAGSLCQRTMESFQAQAALAGKPAEACRQRPLRALAPPSGQRYSMASFICKCKLCLTLLLLGRVQSPRCNACLVAQWRVAQGMAIVVVGCHHVAGASGEDLYNGCTCRTLQHLWRCRWPPRCWAAWRSSRSSRLRCCWWRAASAGAAAPTGAARKKAAPLPITADARAPQQARLHHSSPKRRLSEGCACHRQPAGPSGHHVCGWVYGAI